MKKYFVKVFCKKPTQDTLNGAHCEPEIAKEPKLLALQVQIGYKRPLERQERVHHSVVSQLDLDQIKGCRSSLNQTKGHRSGELL